MRDPATVARRILSRCGALLLATAAFSAAAPAVALAAWQQTATTYTSIAFNQGITFDQAHGRFFFDGVVSASNSGLYRTSSTLALQAARFSVIPPTVEGYNHTGDLSFLAPSRNTGPGSTATGPSGALLLALECYYPSRGGNTCGTGAIAVADPASLRFRYYVNLDSAQIQRAMWDEVSPDGQWIWTSSGTHLLAYRTADVNPATAAAQRAGTLGGIVGTDLGPVLPSGNVTGGAFYTDPTSGVPRLLLSLNLGSSLQVISYPIGVAADGSPVLLTPTPTTEITLAKSFNDNEPEGLAVTGAFNASYPLGAVLHWQMLPAIPFYSSILNFTPN